MSDMGGVRVRGLNELRRELAKLDNAGLIDELKDTNFEVAESIIGPARSRAAGVGAMEARAAATLKASRAAAKARLLFGGGAAPFAGGAEFGANRNVPRGTSRGSVLGWNQFNPWRGSGGGAGYFLYPTIRDRTPDIVEMYGDAIEQITARAFPD